ncbi:hypothetical protein Poly30_19030 [Planctomycetes bacterium Poly30]|uniref:Uncharacterized protein n=1 Tax=Saltatorellus ferox TaxID=2528018 RepID=A0A518EQN0_9BACT|nr:hypothetical protein Poly30_19030 [Planctomycetes bacterium Poly30]
MSGWTFTWCVLLATFGMRPERPQSNDEPLNRFSVPAKEYMAHPIRGFDVRIVAALTEGGDQAETGQRALDAIDRDLGDLLDQLPESAHAFLRSVPIYVGVADPVAPCACYHVSPEWLRRNGFDPAKAKAVEIASALTFLSWRGAQPSMLMHELSHAYHDQVLGKPHAGLTEALRRARASGRFDRVVRFMGNVDGHYALTNEDEYFAETTEALFGVNDFYPFVRGELMAVDPEGAALVTELWKAEPQRMQDDLSMLERKTKAEIARLHRFFVDWFNGTAPATDEAFMALEKALAPGFQMITPRGDVLDRKQLIDRLRRAHGQREVSIETKPLTVKILDGVRVLATYEEHSTEAGATRVIVSTVLFERDPNAPGGLSWVHVHETERRN